MIPNTQGRVTHHHLPRGALFDVLDASLRGVHPREIGLGVSEVAVFLPTLLAEHAQALLLRVVDADLRWDSISLEQQATPNLDSSKSVENDHLLKKCTFRASSPLLASSHGAIIASPLFAPLTTVR